MRGRDQSGSKSRAENRSSSRDRFLEHIELSDRHDLRTGRRLYNHNQHSIFLKIFCFLFRVVLNLLVESPLNRPY